MQDKRQSSVAERTIYTKRNKSPMARNIINLRENDHDTLETIRQDFDIHTGRIPSKTILFRYGLELIRQKMQGMNQDEIILFLQQMVIFSSNIGLK